MTFIVGVRLPSGELVVLERIPNQGIVAEFETEEEARQVADNCILSMVHGYEVIPVEGI